MYSVTRKVNHNGLPKCEDQVKGRTPGQGIVGQASLYSSASHMLATLMRGKQIKMEGVMGFPL